MNPEVKQIWVNALRSGEYKQGKGVLYNRGVLYNQLPTGPCHCGLGVLCEEGAKRGVIEIDPEAQIYRFHADSVDRLVPRAIVEWAGFGDFDDEELKVMKRNDGHADTGSMNFEELADWIEENL